MYKIRPTLTLRQIIIAVAIAIISSFAIYYIFDVAPRQIEDIVFSLDEVGEEEIDASIKEIIEGNDWDRFNRKNVQINQWSLIIEKSDDDACDKGLSFFSKTIEIDIRTLVTRPDRVEQRIVEAYEHPRFGSIPRYGRVEWRFDKNYTREAGRYAEEFRKLYASERETIGAGEAASHEATSKFLSRYGKQVLRNWELYADCSGTRAIEILVDDFSLTIHPDKNSELIELMHRKRLKY
jgi:hypothetical protein